MLHTKIVDFKKEKILTSNAEKFIKDSKFGASIYFLGTIRNINDNKTKMPPLIWMLYKTSLVHN